MTEGPIRAVEVVVLETRAVAEFKREAIDTVAKGKSVRLGPRALRKSTGMMRNS